MAPTVPTTAGRVEGAPSRSGGTALRFAGIPYAAPPVGELRFRPPRPHEGWSGVRPATAVGAVAPQNPSMLDALMGVAPEPWDEDCLFLNVFTPAADDGGRPVMVWLHGGGFVFGSGSVPVYDGTGFAERHDVVVVTVNYRLGELGYLELGHLDASYRGSGNCGLQDQIAALGWVQENIAAFGGDPGNVTVFGESAGAMSVASLLAAPGARGLFHRAIAQSGALQGTRSLEEAEAVTQRELAGLGGQGLEELLAATPAELLRVQGDVFGAALNDPDRVLATGNLLNALPFRPTGDGITLPDDPLAAVAAGASAHVPLLVGTTSEEWNLFALLDQAPIDDAELERRLGILVPGDGEVLAAYRSAHPAADARSLFAALMTDAVFRIPAIQLAEAHAAGGGTAHLYRFAEGSPAMGGLLGACHAIELPYVWDCLSLPGIALLVGEEAPRHLAAQVQEAWATFARRGEPAAAGLPPWPAYDTEARPTMELAATSRLLGDPGGEERRAWAVRAAGAA